MSLIYIHTISELEIRTGFVLYRLYGIGNILFLQLVLFKNLNPKGFRQVLICRQLNQEDQRLLSIKPGWVEHQKCKSRGGVIIPTSKPPPTPRQTLQYCTLYTLYNVAERLSPYCSPYFPRNFSRYSKVCNVLALTIHHISRRFSFYISDHYRLDRCQSCPQWNRRTRYRNGGKRLWYTKSIPHHSSPFQVRHQDGVQSKALHLVSTI